MLRFDVPIEIGADEARRRAVSELLDPVYAQARPPLWQRAVEWVLARLGDVIAAVTGGGGGLVWLLVLAAVLVLIVVVVLRRTGGLRRSARADQPHVVGATRSADAHRRLASAAAARGDWDAAVLERFRAVVRTLEERGVVDERPGRTADETAREVAGLHPDSHTTFAGAASTFDDVVYGSYRADPASYSVVERADELAGRLRAGTGGGTRGPTVMVAPR